MKNKIKRIISSTVGAFLLIAIVCIINLIGVFLYTRLDLTENKIYTLSDASKKIVAKLDTPVVIKFYYSKSNSRMPIFLKNYAQRVEDLLNEYKQAGNGKIILEKFDPEPDSDSEDSAMMDGVDGQMLNTGDKIYLGMAVSCVDKTSSIPFLSPNKAELLEYDITSAISQVYNTEKPVVGVMSALPVMGGVPSPAMMQMGKHQPSPPWIAINNLKQSFDVKEIPLSAEKIDSDIKVLIVIHPSGISDRTQFAIDQFVLNGGKLIAFLDPKSYYVMSHQGSAMNPELMQKSSSTLDKLLKAWGLNFDENKVVADAVFGRKIVTHQRRESLPSVLDMTKKGFNFKNVITSQLESVTMVFAGAFTGTPAEGLQKDVLIKSSEHAALENKYLAGQPGIIARNFHPDGNTYDLAIQLTGKFKTAFPDGAPVANDKKDADPKSGIEPGKNKPEKKYLKESEDKNIVLLFGDSDLLANDICVRIQSLLGQRLAMQLNDNLNLLQNTADFMGGDKDMIGIRCRQAISRPFERVNEMQAEAEQKYQSKIHELEQDLTNTQRRLNELQQRKKKADQRFILSPAQKQELQKFKDRQVKIRKDLKNYRKELRKDIDSLEINLKWLNIALMPLFVALFGLVMAINKKRRGYAK